MKTKRKVLITIVLALVCVLSTLCLVACGGGGGGGGKKAVNKIEVTPPTKVEYKLGEEFSLDGGSIKVTYADGTTEDIALDADGVSFERPNMNSLGRKTITVTYGGKRDRFSITVSEQTYTVTLNMNYTGATNGSVEAVQNKVLEESKVPTPERTNFTFEGWFTDTVCTIPYDFEKVVKGDFTLYARWVATGDTVNFTIDTNCTGLALKTYTQKYAKGDVAVKRSEDPIRKGFKFDGWFTTAACETAYDFTAPVNADTTVYAKWTRTLAAGNNEFVFEVEEIDLSTMTGPGLSGTAQQGGMLGSAVGKGVSGRYLGYLGRFGSTVTFEIDSDVAVTGAKLVVRLSMEARDYTFNPENYVIRVNGEAVTYSPIAFTGVPGFTADGTDCVAFKDYEIGNINLKAGNNKIELVTNNRDALSGTTVEAASPLVDCIKITSTSVLNWDGSKGLPMEW